MSVAGQLFPAPTTCTVSHNTQIHRYTDTQIHKYTNTQIHKYLITLVRYFVFYDS